MLPTVALFFIIANIFLAEKQLQENHTQQNQYDKAIDAHNIALINLWTRKIGVYYSTIHNTILNEQQRYLNHQKLTQQDLDLLQYYTSITVAFNPSDATQWRELFEMVDVLPSNLIATQARLMKKAGYSNNKGNIFNFLCNTPGCGTIDPNATLTQQLPYQYLKIVNYKNLPTEVQAYFWLINTSPAYREFRKLRYQRRLQHLSINDWHDPRVVTLTAPKLGVETSMLLKIHDASAGLNTLPLS